MRIRLLHFVFLMFIILLIPLRCIGQNDGQKFRIMSVYPSPILIGGREIQANDTVSGSSIIEFSSSKQALSVVRCGQAGPPTTFNYALLKDLNPKNLDNAWERWENGEIKDVSNNKSGTLGSKGPESSDANTEPYIFFNGIKDSIRFIPEKRLAIVIGNNSYYNGLSAFRQWWNEVFCIPNNKPATLTKPRIDADNMQNKLVHMGFDVMEVRDATKDEMQKAFKEFFKKAKNYSLVLIYFSGHGVRYKDDDCMLPVDVKSSNVGAKRSALSIDAHLKEFRKLPSNSEGRCLIIITDACRTVFGGKKSEDGELTKTTKLNENELIFQSVSEDEMAFQGNNDNSPSPFTYALIKGIGTGKSIFYEFYQIKKNFMYEGSKPSLDGQPGWFDEHTFVKNGKSTDFSTQNSEN